MIHVEELVLSTLCSFRIQDSFFSVSEVKNRKPYFTLRLRICFQSLYWWGCAVSEMPNSRDSLWFWLRPDLHCQNPHMASCIWRDGGETWMGTARAPATGGARKAIRQIMIVNNTGTRLKHVWRGEVELYLRFNTKWWCSQQIFGIRSYKYAKCQLYIQYIYMCIRASFSIIWNYKNHSFQYVWKWILADVCMMYVIEMCV